MKHLYEKLFQYAEEGIYPYHMPGHKRQSWGMLPEAMYKTDITEIEGFDNLHQPEGILLELQKEAAKLYGAEESYYLVNGSTCGILSAVSSAIPFGGKILMARNCHKSAYHAVYLRHLKVHYLDPPCVEGYGIADALKPEQISGVLEEIPDLGAVLIVSPTYEGRIADVSAIADIVHEKRIPLIVDEAHGAHLGLAEGFAKNSCQAGADLVIHSVHKTLPAMTQTALLHVNRDLVCRDRLRRFLRIYQTSSPSYPLIAGIDNALHYIKMYGQTVFQHFLRQYEEMMKVLSACRHLRFLSGNISEQDIGKLVILVRHTAISGKQLYDILLQRYGLQTEMASEFFVLAMFTVNDREEAYRRMSEALLEIDGSLDQKPLDESMFSLNEAAGNPSLALSNVEIGNLTTTGDCVAETAEVLPADGQDGEKRIISPADSRNGEKRIISPADGQDGESRRSSQSDGRDDERGIILLADAWDMEAEEILLEDSIGRYGAEFINLYPPGIPLLVPGEEISQKLYLKIRKNLEAGLSVQGITAETVQDGAGKQFLIKVIKTEQLEKIK